MEILETTESYLVSLLSGIPLGSLHASLYDYQLFQLFIPLAITSFQRCINIYPTFALLFLLSKTTMKASYLN